MSPGMVWDGLWKSSTMDAESQSNPSKVVCVKEGPNSPIFREEHEDDEDKDELVPIMFMYLF